ncbi:MAG: hypothetical protein AAGA56_13160 [Myxococcota bacterium]
MRAFLWLSLAAACAVGCGESQTTPGDTTPTSAAAPDPSSPPGTLTELPSSEETTTTSSAWEPSGTWEPVTGLSEGKCDGKLEVTPPGRASDLLPPLQWQACSADVPCQQWSILFEAREVKPVWRSNHYPPAAQVSVYLTGQTHFMTAVYSLTSGEPLLGWRLPYADLECSFGPAEAVGDSVWGSMFESETNRAVHFSVALSSGEVNEISPTRFASFERYASPQLLLVETGSIIASFPGDATTYRIGELGTKARYPSITTHGVFHRAQVEDDDPPTVAVWDPTTKTRRDVAIVPAPPPVLDVRATDSRLWWVGVDEPGQLTLYTAPLGGPEPLPATAVGPVRNSWADAYGADDFFVYHDASTEQLVALRPDGRETVIKLDTLPPEGRAVRNLSFAGDDGEYPDSIWFDSGRGMFRLRLP